MTRPATRAVAAIAALAALAGCTAPAAHPLPAGSTAAGPAGQAVPSGSKGPDARTSTAATPADPGTTTASAGPAPDRPEAWTAGSVACRRAAASLPLEVQVGQLMVAGVHASLDPAERALLARRHIGSVILMGTSSGGVAATKRVTAAVTTIEVPMSAAGPIGTMVTVDQEGGRVVRLRGPGFSAMPSAAQQAAMPDERLRDSARTWGRELRAAGVHVDLAPVADVVPRQKASTNLPVGRLGRGYGSDPATVSGKVTAVVAGFHEARLGAVVKHFPGLGEVTANTDFAHRVVDDVTTRDAASLAPFRAAVDAGVDSVMVSTASYPKIDAENPAAFSPTVMAMIRDDLGFGGVISSDDLGVAEAVRRVPPAERALRFVRAGGDLAVTVDTSLADDLAGGLLRAARNDPALASRVEESAGRVLALKARHGLARCRV